MTPKHGGNTSEKESQEISSKNLIYIAQERAFAPGIATGWQKVIVPRGMKNGRLVALNVSDEVMALIELETNSTQPVAKGTTRND